MTEVKLTPESETACELSVYLKAWQRETGYNKADFEEAADWIDNYFKEHPITDHNANIYMLTMTAAAYHAGKEKGAAECQSK